MHEHWHTCRIATNSLFPLLFKLKHCNVYVGHEIWENTVQNILYGKNRSLWINTVLSDSNRNVCRRCSVTQAHLPQRHHCTLHNSELHRWQSNLLQCVSAFKLANFILKVIFLKWLKGAIPPCLWPNEHQISESSYQAFHEWGGQLWIQHP